MKEKNKNNKIRQFQCRLHIEAIIRAGTIGLIISLISMITVLLYGRLRYQRLMLNEAGAVAAIVFALTALLCYFIWMRPRKKEVLARIDALGLQERMITMEELKQVDTVIAEKQRQDTEEHLEQLKAGSLKLRLYMKPLLWSVALLVVVLVLILLPFPEKKVDEQEQQNALEMEIVDEMITALLEIITNSEVNETYKSELKVIVDALAVSFTPEDSTLTRTAKIATASKRLDMMEAAKQSEVTLAKQQSSGSEEAKDAVEALEQEQKRLSKTVKEMKDIMGTSIDVLNKVEGTFWTPGGPSSGTSYEVTPLPFEEEPMEGEEPQEGEEGEPGEDGQLPEGVEPGEEGEPGEGEEGEMAGNGGQTIFDPEQGEVGYGNVYEEYYQEILKALTEREFSEEIREIIEDYANSLE